MKTKSNITKSIFLHVVEPSVPIDNFEFVHLSKIKKIKKHSVSELYIGDILDYISDDDGALLLKELPNKLTKGGKLYIQAYDAKCLSSALTHNNINNTIYRNLLFNNGAKKNIYTMSEIKDLLRSTVNGKINKCKFINGLQYYIEYINE